MTEFTNLLNFVSTGALTVGVGVLCALLFTSLTINVLTICMLYHIYRVWKTWQSPPNAAASRKTTEPPAGYDDVDFSRSAIITVDQSRVDQGRVDQGRVDQSRVDQSRVDQSTYEMVQPYI